MRYLDFLDESRFTFHIEQILHWGIDEEVEAKVFIDNQNQDIYQVVTSKRAYRLSPCLNNDNHDYGDWMDLTI